MFQLIFFREIHFFFIIKIEVLLKIFHTYVHTYLHTEPIVKIVKTYSEMSKTNIYVQISKYQIS